MDAEFVCENCGNKVTGTEYREGYLTLEYHYECPKCGFRRHWAHGNIMPEDSEYEISAEEEG